MVATVKALKRAPKTLSPQENILWNADVRSILRQLPEKELFDLVVTSPPYNIGKSYETKSSLAEYTEWHTGVIADIVKRTKSTGSICWQVGNFIDNGLIAPLDYIFHPIFESMGLQLRNRIIWHYGHGQHQKRRFSGRYEVVLWYTRTDDYRFDLDAVRIPPKYPGKRAYRGPRSGQLSSHPLGKNPEDVWPVVGADHDFWSIPHVKANHVEKTEHPCQFPVGLVERLVLALTKKSDVVFDPYAGTGSAGVAAVTHGRRFWGCEIDPRYASVANDRMKRAAIGAERFRSHAKPLFDHRRSKLSVVPTTVGQPSGTVQR